MALIFQSSSIECTPSERVRSWQKEVDVRRRDVLRLGRSSENGGFRLPPFVAHVDRHRLTSDTSRMPEIDIAIPCYNHGRFLRQCIASVLSQSADIRVLIIDNASTDGSAETARLIAAEDSRVELCLRERNMGPHASFNTGIDWAQSDYFLILCADDLLAPGCLGRALSVLRAETGVALAYGGQVIWEEPNPCPVPATVDGAVHTSIISGPQFAETLSMPHTPIGTGSFVVRTSVQKQVGYYRPELYYTDDLEMLMRLVSLGSAAKMDAVQGIRRRHGGNISADCWGNWKRELQELLAAFESFFANEGATYPWGAKMRKRVRRNIAHRAYWAGVSHHLRGKRQASAELLQFAWSIEPATRFMPPVSYLWHVENVGHLVTSRMREIAVATAARLFPITG
ncbi:glycosyltransferase family 2 protein [Mesorhizobium sp. M3A.F.Ca.ET.174.01.1.1]|nr:glycosyl hydrolase [Mesorhizobium sp. WSM3876]RWE27271.1 MAG: glycosyltransferase family 2 protein [Mesorhizobium sp.]TGS82677.1 glycosyltransferase family 2 protein [Mesorhizobium sp. M3A.F.Ca.ET.175.01.1.1]TGT22622.1 glycosyltransferase family 2 protein [Mesorhizobium sp. M3A.F.Ca.ET.174.01.1.1]TGT54404.1 glycosyltransferase family 2 protein [Mesorhizobium sp. M00.F.Ca.ET.170.01.1.1]